jgi:transposase-like protein
MEIILGQARRRWSKDEKRALVAETLVEGQTVHGVARRHNVSRSMLFCWRKQYRKVLNRTPDASTPIGFAPVAVAGPEPATPPTPPAPPEAMPLIELEFESGARLRISGARPKFNRDRSRPLLADSTLVSGKDHPDWRLNIKEAV